MERNESEAPTLEKVIREIVDNAVKKSQDNISKEEIKEIIREIMPDLDEMIARKIKRHFLEIGEFMVSKFKD